MRETIAFAVIVLALMVSFNWVKIPELPRFSNPFSWTSSPAPTRQSGIRMIDRITKKPLPNVINEDGHHYAKVSNIGDVSIYRCTKCGTTLIVEGE